MDITVDKANSVYRSKDNVLYTKDMKTLIQATPVKTFIIPEHVTAIGGYCLAGCTDVTTVIIPDGVTEIGEGAFDSCERLDNIIIKSECLTQIGYDAFSHIKPDARFTVKNESIKALLQTCGSDLQNGQITVNPNL
ncbi:leucine-rich repeat domain-containing protein [Treponema sp. OMZ 855]|nr:leucine-rich repeat domain-containing protein [Treponema sp. OMZ 855]